MRGSSIALFVIVLRFASGIKNTMKCSHIPIGISIIFRSEEYRRHPLIHYRSFILQDLKW
jgi:hypothetical protein